MPVWVCDTVILTPRTQIEIKLDKIRDSLIYGSILMCLNAIIAQILLSLIVI